METIRFFQLPAGKRLEKKMTRYWERGRRQSIMGESDYVLILILAVLIVCSITAIISFRAGWDSAVAYHEVNCGRMAR